MRSLRSTSLYCPFREIIALVLRGKDVTPIHVAPHTTINNKFYILLLLQVVFQKLTYQQQQWHQGNWFSVVLSASIFRLDNNTPLVCKQMCIYSFFQNWLAYDVLPASWNFTERGKLYFSGLGAPKEENNYAFCQVGINSNSFLYVSDEPLFSLDQLRRKIVSLISQRRCCGMFLIINVGFLIRNVTKKGLRHRWSWILLHTCTCRKSIH